MTLEKKSFLDDFFFTFFFQCLKVALSHHLVARTMSCLGDFRNALKNEKETFSIYTSELGPTHDKTKESDERLRHLTQQAVMMARKMNEVCSEKNSKVCFSFGTHSMSY